MSNLTDAKNNFIDVTHGLGAPFGGIGTGYFVYGRHGFVNVNMNGFPDLQQTNEYPKGVLWDYENANPAEAPFALYCEVEGKRHLLQQRGSSVVTGMPAKRVQMAAYMPFGQAIVTLEEETEISLLLYSSAKPHDVERTSVPACIFEMTVTNKSTVQREYRLGLDYDKAAFQAVSHEELLVLSEKDGNVAFGFAQGENGTGILTVPAGESRQCVAVLAWYYPLFTTPGIAADDIIFQNNLIQDYDRSLSTNTYKRHYTVRFSSAEDVARKALAEHGVWRQDIEDWHNSFDAPPAVKRVWFGSYASVITASLYTKEGFYLEIEQPHGCLSTMDVCAYSTWIYMINWPEIEQTDLRQYAAANPQTGKVWHSLWNDSAHYVEEAVYAIRVWRYVLWTRDESFLAEAFDSVTRALEYVYINEGRGFLLNNIVGNQSYDGWKMPGIGVYINNQWLYALYAYKQMCRRLGKPAVLAEIAVDEFLAKATKEYNDELWDDEAGYWIAYKPNDASEWAPFGDAIFSDQLFGHWMLLCDKGSRDIIDWEQEKRAIRKIYTHNRFEDPENGGSCWVNGVLPEREKSTDTFTFGEEEHRMAHHALTCWLGAQLDLASMLAFVGQEAESEDVFVNISKELGKNMLAAGEWNRKLGDGLQALATKWEVGKDTPRFPPYPRYKSSWEYVTRLLGVEMDFDTITFKPMKTMDFSLTNVAIAGMTVSVSVKKNWTRILVDGVEGEASVDRNRQTVALQFV